MDDVVRRLATAVAPGGHLLVVAHAPSEHLFAHHPESQRRAMFLAADVVPALPEDFEALVVEQRPRTVTREGRTFDIDDSTLLARRRQL